ncbi:dienelactone hydrolase family protein [Nisaea nitritireducens]|uniref:dienelactone hydrolase family protein n=1 Tax=Nisaea nitritireducens TaxID=568392 RepID=UPI001866610C|nr:dienelactone hydrolase family protein [Nisaea nitritireducens]
MDTSKIDPRIYALYDQYCHSSMKRREFLKRASAIAVVSGSGLAMAEALLPNYAAAQTISFTDPRIKATYETYESPGGNSGEMRGYLVQPAGDGPFPAVLVVHENRGLNPYIEDVARRAAVAGFLAFAPDGLWPAGGYPGNDDDGKVLQASLDRGKIHVDMLNGAKFLKSYPLSNGKLGATGFCFGGGVVGYLAVEMGADLNAGAPFYGRQPADADVARIKAPILAHYAEEDPRVNAGIGNFEAALKANSVEHTIHVYPGTNHGFHNNSTPRYNETAAKLAWERTTAFFASKLAG